jgi:uncharacterized protein YcbK (DUF882 family)
LLAPAAEAMPRIRVTGRVHVVYPGQTLAMIAKRYKVSVEELCKANNITRRSPIRPKQKLVIPGTTDPQVIPAAVSKSHTDVDDKKSSAYAKKPRRRGILNLQSYTGSWHGLAVKDGKVTDAGRTGIDRVLASWRTGQKEHINDRLIRLLTKVSDHFGGRPVRVVSGFRPFSPNQYTSHSRHNTGHAVDFSVPGVPNQVVRDFCRTFVNVGVGYYPNSSFVHLDVRETSTYWVDFSGPGQAPRYANAQGRDPGDADGAASERDEPASGNGDGTPTFEPDSI